MIAVILQLKITRVGRTSLNLVNKYPNTKYSCLYLYLHSCHYYEILDIFLSDWMVIKIGSYLTKHWINVKTKKKKKLVINESTM